MEVKKDKPKEEEENKDQETGKENGTKEAVGDGEDEEVIFWGKSKVRQINYCDQIALIAMKCFFEMEIFFS